MTFEKDFPSLKGKEFEITNYRNLGLDDDGITWCANTIITNKTKFKVVEENCFICFRKDIQENCLDRKKVEGAIDKACLSCSIGLKKELNLK